MIPTPREQGQQRGFIVVPVQTGTHPRPPPLDSRLRGNDGYAKVSFAGIQGWKPTGHSSSPKSSSGMSTNSG